MFQGVHKDNLFVMKLLTTDSSFLDEVKKIRKSHHVPDNGFSSVSDKEAWDRERQKRWPKRMPPGYISDFDKSCKELVVRRGLRFHFLSHITRFVLFGAVAAPERNFKIRTDKMTAGRGTGKYFSLEVYAPLTKEELRAAIKQVNKYITEYLPKTAQLDWRPHVDIDLALRIESEMDRRYRRLIQQPATQYAVAAKKGLSEEDYEKLIKTRPGLTKKIWEKYVSGDVAKKLLGDKNKAGVVRKIYSRIKAKRKQLVPRFT